jgi:hypothetical protein
MVKALFNDDGHSPFLKFSIKVSDYFLEMKFRHKKQERKEIKLLDKGIGIKIN